MSPQGRKGKILRQKQKIIEVIQKTQEFRNDRFGQKFLNPPGVSEQQQAAFSKFEKYLHESICNREQIILKIILDYDENSDDPGGGSPKQKTVSYID